MRVCLLTPGQPSNNPRLVKEADALSTAGHVVHVICADGGLWPSETDGGLLATRSWSCEYAGGSPKSRPTLYRWTRLRHALSRRLLRIAESPFLRTRALTRAGIEIERSALRLPADLYIAHHPTVLPAAMHAGIRYGARVGYDAEDFCAGMWNPATGPDPIDRLMEATEEEYLKKCHYITASSPEIAGEYVSRFGIHRPTPVLNVFSLADRPSLFRQTADSGPLRLYWFSQCIGSERGLEDAVMALGLLRDCALELHLQGAWQAGYHDRLLALATEWGVTGRLHVLPPAPPDEMVRRSSGYDIGLALEIPSTRNRSICLTNKIFTYLLAGNAILATNTPAQQKLLSSLTPAAITYTPGDIEALAAQLRRWYVDRNALDEARQCSWAWGEKRYNWDFERRSFLAVAESTDGY